jgi:hypothetical protein
MIEGEVLLQRSLVRLMQLEEESLKNVFAEKRSSNRTEKAMEALIRGYKRWGLKKIVMGN